MTVRVWQEDAFPQVSLTQAVCTGSGSMLRAQEEHTELGPGCVGCTPCTCLPVSHRGLGAGWNADNLSFCPWAEKHATSAIWALLPQKERQLSMSLCVFYTHTSRSRLGCKCVHVLNSDDGHWFAEHAITDIGPVSLHLSEILHADHLENLHT